ncbi:SIS domain-containing protein [Streptococcus pantholopis]|uniref:Carbohydrate isomerase n=1 Tax=Streptococcus pantholopis TaxID=1811193 RepID=A0A172Q940_9STRE|nr:carbohydrate isomerase [Streptococcus pantholopis]
MANDIAEKQLNYFTETLATEVSQFMAQLDKSKIYQAADLILNAKQQGGRVHITGIGKPSHVSHYTAALFSSTGTPSYFLDATEALHGSAGQVMSGDIVIAVSNSGETQELQRTVEALKKLGVTLIAVTGGASSWLAENTDLTLFAGVEQEGDSFNKPPRASVVVEILILQALSIVLQEKNRLNLKQYHLWHPGGALGESLERE